MKTMYVLIEATHDYYRYEKTVAVFDSIEKAKKWSLKFFPHMPFIVDQVLSDQMSEKEQDHMFCQSFNLNAK